MVRVQELYSQNWPGRFAPGAQPYWGRMMGMSELEAKPTSLSPYGFLFTTVAWFCSQCFSLFFVLFLMSIFSSLGPLLLVQDSIPGPPFFFLSLSAIKIIHLLHGLNTTCKQIISHIFFLPKLVNQLHTLMSNHGLTILPGPLMHTSKSYLSFI